MKQCVGTTTKCYQCECLNMTLEEYVCADWEKLYKEWKIASILPDCIQFYRWKKKNRGEIK